MEKLRIAQIAPLWIPVPPRTYGGIELMVHYLTEELVQRGHDVTLFASGDSQTSAKLISPSEKALWLEKDLKNPHAAVMKMVKLVKEQAGEFDIIHNHFNFFMFPLLLCNDMPPMLTSIRRPMDNFYAAAINAYTGMKFTTLSKDAKNAAEKFGLDIMDYVYNGLDIEKYEFNSQPDDYLLFLGRLNQRKGVLEAAHAAKEVGKKLVIAGNVVGAEEWNFFMREIQPLLNEPNISYVGQVDFGDKIRWMKGASALLFPISVREAFGNVMIEAMACGTPVIAFNNGSVPEIVVNKKTGFVVNNVKEMVNAIRKIDKIDRLECRRHVENKFTLEHMTDKYEEVYNKIVNGTK